MSDIIDTEDRLLWIDRDPEEGFMSIGLYSGGGDGYLYLTKEESIRLYNRLEVDLQIKGALPWKERV